MRLPGNFLIVSSIILVGLVSFSSAEDGSEEPLENIVACPPLAPLDFDCSRQAYMECIDPNWPSESNNFERPAQVERSLPGNAVTGRLERAPVFKHFQDFNVTAFQLMRSKSKAKRGNPGLRTVNHTDRETATAPNTLQTRGICCRPTWECWELVKSVEVESDYLGRPRINDMEDFRKVLCCLERFWEPTPECPEGPLRQIPGDWLEPPACSETD